MLKVKYVTCLKKSVIQPTLDIYSVQECSSFDQFVLLKTFYDWTIKNIFISLNSLVHKKIWSIVSLPDKPRGIFLCVSVTYVLHHLSKVDSWSNHLGAFNVPVLKWVLKVVRNIPGKYYTKLQRSNETLRQTNKQTKSKSITIRCHSHKAMGGILSILCRCYTCVSLIDIVSCLSL